MGVAGLVGPKPVPNRSSTSPGCAGTVANAVPNRFAGPIYGPSERTAATYFRPCGSNRNSEGERVDSAAFTTLLAAPPYVTCTATGTEAVSAGGRPVIWPGLMKFA